MDNHKSKNQLRKEIAALIDNIKEHSDNIGSLKRIPQIELEFITAKIKKVYEKSIIFNYLNAQDDRPNADSYTEKSIIDVEVPVFENMPDMDKYSNREEINTDVKIEDARVIPRSIVAEMITPVIIEEVAAPEIKPLEEVKKEEAANIPAPEKPIVSASPAAKQLRDLRSYIGINDRIQFTTMLFKNNADNYNNAIELLNGATEFNTSKNLIEQLKTTYAWEKDSDAYLNLISLIELRHR